MFTDKQALIIATIMLALFFFGGVFNILHNYLVMTLLITLFLAININLIVAYRASNRDSSNKKESENIK